MRIACLHTASGNAALFDACRPDGVELRHLIRADLLAAAEREGGLNDDIVRSTREALAEAASGAAVVLLTCSTLGPALDGWSLDGVPVLRADAAVAREAARDGGRVGVLCTAPTTVAATHALFEATGADVETHLVPDAWSAFRGGDLERYFGRIASAAEALHARGITRLVLAQVSMAPAAERCKVARPLTVPGLALAAAIEVAT